MSKKKKRQKKNIQKRIPLQKNQPSQINANVIYAIISLVIIGITIWYLLSSNKTSSSQPNNQSNNQTQSSNPAAQTSTSPGSTDFKNYCARCHGLNGEGSNAAPSLKGVNRNADDIAAFAAQGTSNMPAFSSQLDQKRLKAIGKYIRTFK